MQIRTDYIDIPVAVEPLNASFLVRDKQGHVDPSQIKMMRAFLAHPVVEGKYPGILLFSDIFQLSHPMLRTCARLAGYGFVVVAHEIFHRLEPPGTVLNQDDEGRARGMKNQQAMPIAHFDEDCRGALDFLGSHPLVRKGSIGAGGFCIGGHLAFRAALQPEVKATVCFYPTWLHNGKLGQGEKADSLARAADVRGEMLLIFGSLDPLIPPEGREVIESTLKDAGIRFTARLYPADHGFIRDDRAAYDPEYADQAFTEAVGFYRRAALL